jgi:type I restriction enzyme R subunit
VAAAGGVSRRSPIAQPLRQRRAVNDEPWLTHRQLDELRDQLLRQPNRALLEANEAAQALLLKAQVDRNEVTSETDPVVKLIDFAHPERNQFHPVNQFRVDTPGCVKSFIIPDIVLFVNGIPLVVVEAKIGDPNTANPLHAAFVQLQRYRNARPETLLAGLREGEPRLFYTNLLLVRTCGEKAQLGTITSGSEHFFAWKDVWPPPDRTANRPYTPPLGVEREQEMLIQGLLAPATLLDVLRTCTVFMDTDAAARHLLLGASIKPTRHGGEGCSGGALAAPLFPTTAQVELELEVLPSDV